MRLFLICLCLTSSLLARIECVNLDDYQNWLCSLKWLLTSLK